MRVLWVTSKCESRVATVGDRVSREREREEDGSPGELMNYDAEVVSLLSLRPRVLSLRLPSTVFVDIFILVSLGSLPRNRVPLATLIKRNLSNPAEAIALEADKTMSYTSPCLTCNPDTQLNTPGLALHD